MKTISKNKASVFNISIIGGGRWARVILEVICRIVDKSINISVYSKNNSTGMSEWASSKFFDHNIQVFKDLPTKFYAQTNAVIVVNAARDHEEFTLTALSAGGNILVEKPIALSYESGERLAKAAKQFNKHLTSAHVFLFANYFIKFTKLVLNAGKISKINIHWEDPGFEDRYGEKKLYDSGLPVFSDWLPHVLSMISAIITGKEFIFLSIELDRGGANVTIEILASDIPCRIILTRNGKLRKRLMEVNTETKKLQLDFTKEPGTIYDGTNEIADDNEWEFGQSPLESMLSSFLKGVSGEVFDKRLNLEIGLNALKVIDMVMIDYREKQLKWLIENLFLNYANKVNALHDENTFYALSEIFQSIRPLNMEQLNKKIEKLLIKLNQIKGKSWLAELKNCKLNDAISQLNEL
jgi:predicted dehydrogenase